MRRSAYLVSQWREVGEERGSKKGTGMRELKWKQIHTFYIFFTLREVFFLRHVFAICQKDTHLS